MAKKQDDTAVSPQVVIVGAGPSGLAAAIELGSRGIRCLVIERGERAGYAPRAKTTHIRTREHLRRWGIADRLAEASPFGIKYPSDVVFVTSLGGHEIARIENAMYCDPTPDERYSEHAQWIPQYKLEAVMREHAVSLPTVTLEFGCEFLSLQQDDAGVIARVRRDDSDWEIECDYLIGADGARSAVRDSIGARMEGTYGLSTNYNTIFRAPGLASAHKHGPAIMYWQLGGGAPSLIGPMDRDDIWFFMPTGLPRGSKLSDADVLALIRRSTGIDLEYEILSSDVWVASRFLADRYASDRAFLIGDACHLHPPFGGYGMNLGIADGVDLGWKMAAVLRGWGGAALLASYEAERRAAHVFVLDEAESNHRTTPDKLAQPDIEEPGDAGMAARARLGDTILEVKRAEFHAMGVTLGFCYENSPVIVSNPGAATWAPSHSYTPSAVPGCLAPHHWLAPGVSLYDAFGPNMTLLVTTPLDSQERARLVETASTAGVPIKVVPIDGEWVSALYQTRYTLIRPDQIIAWQSACEPDLSIYSKVSGSTL